VVLAVLVIGGEQLQVLGPIIGLHMVPVVNDFPWAKPSAKHLLHDQAMLEDVVTRASTWMIGHEQDDVAVVSCSTAFPVGAICPPYALAEFLFRFAHSCAFASGP